MLNPDLSFGLSRGPKGMLVHHHDGLPSGWSLKNVLPSERLLRLGRSPQVVDFLPDQNCDPLG